MANHWNGHRPGRLRAAILAAVLAGLVVGQSAWAGEAVRSEARIRTSPHAFRVRVGGNFDETRYLRPNRPPARRFVSRVTIRNDGDTAVKNPRIAVNGFRTPLSTDELLANLVPPHSDDLDGVLRIFHAVIQHNVHRNMPEDADPDPLWYFLNYGYGVCFNLTDIQAVLWGLRGHRVRSSEPFNHMAGEVEIRGRGVHMDADAEAYYLLRDNRTIASADDIREDPLLVLRAAHYANPERFPRLAGDPDIDMWESAEKAAALYARRDPPPWAAGPATKRALPLLLRPGESYGWHTGERSRVHPALADPEFGKVGREVLWETNLDFTKPSHRWCFREGASAGSARDEGLPGTARSASVAYDLPFPVMGGDIRLFPRPQNPRAEGTCLVEVRIATPDGQERTLRVSREKMAKEGHSLDELIQDLPYPCRNMRVEIRCAPGQEMDGCALDWQGVWIRLYGQSTTYALPALRAGNNALGYTDEAQERLVAVVVEAEPQDVPAPVLGPGQFFPGHKDVVSEAALQFLWPRAKGADVGGYHLQIGLHEDMRYPLSPSFDRMEKAENALSKGDQVRSVLPWSGVLPVGSVLYWRVRPYSKEGVAGDWSEVRAFQVRAPLPPEDLQIVREQGRLVLAWKAGRGGSRPQRYEVHASCLEGFLPVSGPHRLLGWGDENKRAFCWTDVCAAGWPTVPGTLLAATTETRLALWDERDGGQKKPGAHFRVIAVDAEGSRSAPSAQAHLQTPLIASPGYLAVPAGEVSFPVEAVSTAGRILARQLSEEEQGYHLGLWEKPKLEFSLVNPPTLRGNWRIDKQTGLIRGQIRRGERFVLSVQVKDQFRRSDTKDIVFEAKEAP